MYGLVELIIVRFAVEVQRLFGIIHVLFGQVSVICIVSIGSGPLLVTARVNLIGSHGRYDALSEVLRIVAFAPGAYVLNNAAAYWIDV